MSGDVAGGTGYEPVKQLWTILFVVLFVVAWAIASSLDRGEAKRRGHREAPSEGKDEERE